MPSRGFRRWRTIFRLMFGFSFKNRRRKNLNVLHLQGLFVAVWEESGDYFFFLSGLWRVFTLTCCSRLPVAVCVNGFFLWGGRRRGDLMMACDASFRAASFIWCVHPPRSHGTRKKSWSWETRTVSVRQVSFFFRDHFFCEEFHCIKINFWLFVSFFLQRGSEELAMSNGAVLSPQSNHADNNNDAKKVKKTTEWHNEITNKFYYMEFH